MIEVVLYTLIEYVNYYMVYRNVFGIRFTSKKAPYFVIILSSCMVQIVVWCFVDHTWRDVIPVLMGFLGAVILTESKKWKTILLYLVVVFGSSLINIMGAYGLGVLLRVEQQMIFDSLELTLLSECTAILVCILVDILIKRRSREEKAFTVGQYVILLIGVVCFFIIVAFVQSLLLGDVDFLNENRNLTATASVIIALVFFGLAIWQQRTWEKALRYHKENEKYEVFLASQEEHIRMLILEDEKRRKLRHDMDAHMLALSTMAEKEEWDCLKRYLCHMKDGAGYGAVTKYTNISAVDAIVEEWHCKAIKCHAEWDWKGTFPYTDRVTIYELCIVFSNLLSNAVEAIEKKGNGGKIKIRISNFQEKMVFVVSNTCNQLPEFIDRPMTTKGDSVYHGLGLKNVEEIVNKHGGDVDYKIENGWFHAKILL